jgi:hypothetical protein
MPTSVSWRGVGHVMAFSVGGIGDFSVVFGFWLSATIIFLSGPSLFLFFFFTIPPNKPQCVFKIP